MKKKKGIHVQLPINLGKLRPVEEIKFEWMSEEETHQLIEDLYTHLAEEKLGKAIRETEDEVCKKLSQPERSKREDLERGCGALNSVET